MANDPAEPVAASEGRSPLPHGAVGLSPWPVQVDCTGKAEAHHSQPARTFGPPVW